MNEDNGFMNGFYAGRDANNNNCGFGGGNGGCGWIWIILIIAIFAGSWGFGGGFGGGYGGGSRGGGAADNYVLTSDFSQLSRQMSDGFNSQERKLDGINNGLCSGFYQEAQLINGTNMNIAQGFAGAELSRANQQAALMAQLSAMQMQAQQCCCDQRQQIADVKYAMALGDAATQRVVENGFMQTGYNLADQSCQTRTLLQSNTRDVIDNQNANARAILDALAQNKYDALKDKYDALLTQYSDLRFAKSQIEQNAFIANNQAMQTQAILDKLDPCPKPSYIVQPPQQVTFPTNCCGGVNYAAAYNNGCACMG